MKKIRVLMFMDTQTSINIALEFCINYNFYCLLFLRRYLQELIKKYVIMMFNTIFSIMFAFLTRENEPCG